MAVVCLLLLFFLFDVKLQSDVLGLNLFVCLSQLSDLSLELLLNLRRFHSTTVAGVLHQVTETLVKVIVELLGLDLLQFLFGALKSSLQGLVLHLKGP